jgi:hypothetical protein
MEPRQAERTFRELCLDRRRQRIAKELDALARKIREITGSFPETERKKSP